MLKIRLKRTGCKKKPIYRIILVENLSKRDGNCITKLGYYDPIKKVVFFNKTMLYKYIMHGAYPTDTIRHLIWKMS